MSSIYSLLKRGKRSVPASPTNWESTEELLRIHLALARFALAHEENCVLVNAQGAFDDVRANSVNECVKADWSALGPLTPGFRWMWLEGTIVQERYAWQVLRGGLNGPNDNQVNMWLWAEHEARALGPLAHNEVHLTDDGRLKSRAYTAFEPPPDCSKETLRNNDGLYSFLACHALAKMNCRNVELRRIPEPKVRRKSPVVVPASVWHTIHLRDVPKIQSSGAGAFRGDENNQRLSWVRGHYADYRNGAGLFGNPKLRCVFWIPEFQRGNAELGEVIPEYQVH